MDVVVVVGPRLRWVGLLMETERRVYGPVVEWLVSRGCSAKFGVARSSFVLLTRRSMTSAYTLSDFHASPILSNQVCTIPQCLSRKVEEGIRK